MKRPKFKKTVLSNGLTVLSERHRGFRGLSIGVWVKIGTRNELAHEAGISHFLEHMLFKGTANRTALDIAREVDRVGGDFNAFTSREQTCFHILLLNRDVRLGIDILGDVLLNSDFDPEEFERERKVILQEISMVEEDSEELVFDAFYELIYGSHGLGKPILGTERGLKKMKRGDVVKFFRKHYRPDQIIVAVSGDVSHESFVKLLKPLASRKWPGRLPAKKRPAKAALAKAAVARPKLQPGCWWLERPTEQVHLVWGVEGPAYASRDRFAAYLLNVYLGGGMSSELFQEIREKNGLAYNVYSSLCPFADSGVFSIYAATGPNQVPLCLALIEKSVDRLKKHLLTQDELRVIQDNLKGSILLAADDVESRMSSIAKNEIFFGRYFSVDEVCRQIDVVTPEDVRRVARKLLKSDLRSIVALGPKPSRELAKVLKPEYPARFNTKGNRG